MGFSKLSLRACIVSLTTILGAAAVSTTIAAAEVRLACSAEGPGDISMQARFERRDNGRRKFSTEFEARAGGAFAEGQRMTVVVADVKVGSVRLRQVAGGDLQGDLNLDDAAGPGDDAKPFPPDFPQVERGTRVVVRIEGERVLACRLQ